GDSGGYCSIHPAHKSANSCSFSPCRNNRFEVTPCVTAFALETALPAGVVGPVHPRSFSMPSQITPGGNSPDRSNASAANRRDAAISSRFSLFSRLRSPLPTPQVSQPSLFQDLRKII